MSEERILAAVPGGSLRVRVRGPEQGERILFLHGGPGLADAYLDGLIDEFADSYRVAVYAQRGVAPSTASEPFDLAVQAADAAAVLDALGWPDAVVVGHSWGGHLLLHVLAGHADRLRAAVALDPIGGVGDGGAAAFETELLRRLADDARRRLDAPDLGEEEQLRVVWPAYFPPGTAVPDPLPTAYSREAGVAGWEALEAALPALADRLRGLRVPTLFLVADGSPIPASASTDTAAVLGGAAVVARVPGGHFPWLLHPGSVRAAVDRFLATLP